MKRDCTCAQVRHQHGTEQAYISDGCHCTECRRAHADKAAWRRRMQAYGWDIAHLVPADGTRRRIQALMTLGWSCEALGRRLGWDPITLHRAMRQPRVLDSKAAAVTALYDALWDVRPPETARGERISVRRTCGLAARRGYVPPLGWDDETIDDPTASPKILAEGDGQLDEIAVERYMRGTLCGRSPERREAIRRLIARGMSDAEVGARVGMSKDAVFKERERHGISTAQQPGRAA